MSISTMKSNHSMKSFGLETGSALLMSLIFLIILTVLGLAALNSSTNQTQISANIQQFVTAFYSSQSAANAFANEGNAGNDLIEGDHILQLTRDKADPGDADTMNLANALRRCVAADGSNSADCDTTFIQENFKARTDTWYRGCLGPATECPGFSLGVGTTIPGCHRYQVRGTGWVDISGGGEDPSVTKEESTAVIDQWLTEVALCPSA